MSDPINTRKREHTDTSNNSVNQLGVTGNSNVRDISQNNTTCNFQGPTTINVNSEDQSRQLRCSNLDQPSSSRSEDAIVTDLTEKLKEWYSDLQLPLVSWMSANEFPLDEYYMPLQLNSVRRAKTNENADNDELRKKIQLGSQSDSSSSHSDSSSSQGDFSWSLSDSSSSQSVTDGQSVIDDRKRPIILEDILESVDGISPKRILVEGQPGLGKTTLAHKIMHDWRKGKNYAKRFDFALLIPLRYLKDKTLREVVLERLEGEDNKKVWNLINSDRTLLVLDGLDEVGDSSRENILKMLYDKTGNKMTIVVTCRTGLFKLDESERKSLFLGLAKSTYFWDKKIDILGFDHKSRKRFLEKFVTRESYDKFVKKFTKVINRNMLRSPLILILFVFISEDVETFTIETKTELYKKLVDCIIKRCVSKDEKVKLDENFTMFGNKNSGDYEANFCKFGRISIDHILNDNLQFECDKLTDVIYQMGFLMKHETIKNRFKVHAHYEGCHLTFLEFAAAFSLWDEFKKNGNKFLIDSIYKINEICLKMGSLSMVLPFLFGLTGNYVEKLFDQLLDFCVMYSTDTDLMMAILPECELDGCKIVENFLPKLLHCDGSTYPFWENKNSNNYGNIEVSCADIWKLAEFKNIYAESICVNIAHESYGKCSFKNNVKCESIFITVYGECEYFSYLEMADQLGITLNVVSSSYKHLVLYESCGKNLINECVKNGVLKNQTIEYLYFYLTVHEIDTELLENIIKHNTVKALNLAVNDCKILDKIIPIVVSSPDLLSLTLECVRFPSFCRSYWPEVDLSSITNNVKKRWHHIGLDNIDLNLKNSASISNNACIDSFQINDNYCSVKVETNLSLKFSTLHLSHELCNRLMLTQAACLKSVTELTLDITKWGGFGSLGCLRCLDKFTKLKKVTLVLGDLLHCEVQRDTVKSIRSLKLDQLHFCVDGVCIDADFFNCVKDLLEKNELAAIGNIVFAIEIDSTFEIGDYSDILSALKLALLSDSKVTAHFIKSSTTSESIRSSYSTDNWSSIFNTFDFRQFNIQRRISTEIRKDITNFSDYTDIYTWYCGDVLEIQKRARK